MKIESAIQISTTSTADPKNDRQITKVSFIEFSNADAAKRALDKLGGKGKKLNVSDSGSCTLAPAISLINRKRNWSLRDAEKLIKASSSSSDGNVALIGKIET